ncbi:MAG: transporter substrate-binding domain-containing protein [Holophaga sp.]|nr:transporter substrate-binding domain-containing protein [Holophaga sp.]
MAKPLKIYTEISIPQQIKAPDGSLSGIAVDTVREIQKRVGSSDPIQLVPWARGYQEATTEPNVLLFSMGRTAEREHLFQWVGPVDELVFSLFVKAGSPIKIKNLNDAKKLHSIGVYKNDVRDLFLTKAGLTNLDRASDAVTNVKKVMAGHLDALASSESGIADLAKSAGFQASDLKAAYPFMRIQLYMAFSHGTPAETVSAWSGALAAMKKDKTFEHIYRKYDPTKALPGPALPPQ